MPRIVQFWTTQGRAAIPALVLVAILCMGAGASRRAPVHIAVAIREMDPNTGALSLSPCPPRMLPDGDVCVRLPEDDDGAREPEPEPSGRHDPHGRATAYDEIPRRPDRPADYDAYRYPVPCDRGCVATGHDLDRPEEMQRRRGRLSDADWSAPRTLLDPAPKAAMRGTADHGAVDLPQKKGTPVVAVDLEHQQGDAEVIYIGPIFGTTVITRHTLREAGQLRDYLLLFGHLDAQSPGLQAGSRVKEGEILGFVGDTASPKVGFLHLQARRVRGGVDVGKLAPSAIVANENTMVCDPRNIMPLKPSP